jgi:hypothetical protein
MGVNVLICSKTRNDRETTIRIPLEKVKIFTEKVRECKLRADEEIRQRARQEIEYIARLREQDDEKERNDILSFSSETEQYVPLFSHCSINASTWHNVNIWQVFLIEFTHSRFTNLPDYIIKLLILKRKNA